MEKLFTVILRILLNIFVEDAEIVLLFLLFIKGGDYKLKNSYIAETLNCFGFLINSKLQISVSIV